MIFGLCYSIRLRVMLSRCSRRGEIEVKKARSSRVRHHTYHQTWMVKLCNPGSGVSGTLTLCLCLCICLCHCLCICICLILIIRPGWSSSATQDPECPAHTRSAVDLITASDSPIRKQRQPLRSSWKTNQSDRF